MRYPPELDSALRRINPAGERQRGTLSVDQRLTLAHRLGELDFASWRPMAEHLVCDPSSRVRTATALSVANSPGASGLPLLEKLAGDGSWQVRRSAALAIAREPGHQALRLLLRLSRDPVSAVREAAQQGLLRLRALAPGLVTGASADIRRRARKQFREFQAAEKITLSPKGVGMGSAVWSRVISRGSGATRADPSFGGHDIPEPPSPQGEGSQPLAVEEPAGQEAQPRDQRQAPEAPGERYVNSWFHGHADASQPLAYGYEYELSIQVDPRMRAGSHTQGRPHFYEPEAADSAVDVVVALVSNDFEILGPAARRLRLPTDRRLSSPRLIFRVRPVKNNQDVFLQVLFFQGNALFHEAVVGARAIAGAAVGEGEESAVLPAEEIYRAEPKATDATLQIVRHGTGYRMVLFSDDGVGEPTIDSCHLSITRSQVAALLESLRRDLLVALELESSEGGAEFFDAEPPAQARAAGRLPVPCSVSEELYRRALGKLARVGLRILSNLFGSAEDSADALAFQSRLAQLSQERELRLQILSEELFLPWNFVYDGPAREPIDANRFWGFRHVIEEIPYRMQLPAPSQQTLDGESRLGLNLNRNSLHDVVIDPQVVRLCQLLPGDGRLLERTSEAEVLEALSGEEPHGQIEYFFCHAGAEGEAADDYGQSYLGLSASDHGLTLEEIRLATFGQRFDGRPLFILNACESVQMDGRFYDGFVPRLLRMGAAAVVGSECKVPEVLGSHLGLDLLESLLAGRPLGRALLEARRSFLEAHNNPFGLLYRTFGDSDLRFART